MTGDEDPPLGDVLAVGRMRWVVFASEPEAKVVDGVQLVGKAAVVAVIAADVAVGKCTAAPMVALAAGMDSVAEQRFPRRLTVSRLLTKAGRGV